MPKCRLSDFRFSKRTIVATFLLALVVLSGCSSDDSDRDAAEPDNTATLDRGETADNSIQNSTVGGFDDWADEDDDPVGNRSLDVDYPDPPYPPDERVLGRFMDAFKTGDLDRMSDAWSQMGPAQRLLARERGMDYRFSVPEDEYELNELVQAPFDLLGTANNAKLQFDAAANARGELRSMSAKDSGPELPDELGHVRGFVVDGETGAPLAGVQIAASFPQVMLFALSGDSARWETISGADGSFEIRDIPAGEAALLAHRLPEYNMLQQAIEISADQTIDETIALPKLGRLQLELPTFVSGTVSDSETGTPVPGVLVSIANSSSSARTNASGAYIIRKVDLGEHSIFARHKDYHDGGNTIVAAGPGKIELDFSIDPITTGIIVGTAVNSTTGEALANVTVTIAGQTVTTDAEGRFRIAEIESGDVHVQAGTDGFRPAGSDLTLAARSTAETVLELDPITEGTVHGTVRSAATGEPIAGADVRVGNFDAVSDDQGRFEIIDVPQGSTSVTAQKSLFEPKLQTIDVVAMQSVTVEIELEPITYGDLVVTVTDASIGKPIASSLVRLSGDFSGETDKDGRIRFEKVPAGDGLASAERHAYITGEAAYVLEPGTEIEHAIALQPVTVGSIEGIVRNASSGEPIPDATVTAGNRSVRTDGSGRYRIDDLAAGTVNLTGRKPVFEAGGASASIIAAESVAIDIELEPITYGSIHGVVVDALTSAPVADVVVTVVGQNTKTNASGEFVLERVSAGDITLSASKRVYEQVEDRFELLPAETEIRRIALPPITYGDIAGQVIDAESGTPLASVDVSLGTKRVRTDASGRFGPERVDAGPMNVSAYKTSYESGGTTVEVAPADTTTTVIELEPIRIGIVVGTVIDAKTNEPVDGARVTLAAQAKETAADGRFRFDKVSTGSVGVAVRHADYGNGAASGDLEGGATLELVVRVDLRREDVTQLEAGLASGGSIDLYGIHFDSGKDQFKASSLGTLNAVLEVMKRAPDRNFTIAGHTDADGSDAANQDLSERRARTVINWLVDHGIEKRRLTGSGFGESRPTAPNDTESGKALNRRVELSFGN